MAPHSFTLGTADIPDRQLCGNTSHLHYSRHWQSICQWLLQRELILDALGSTEISYNGTREIFKILRDGRLIVIRAVRPGDRDGLLAAVGRVAAPSLYRRFLGARTDLPNKRSLSSRMSTSSITLRS
jgi:hypothetical protein